MHDKVVEYILKVILDTTNCIMLHIQFVSQYLVPVFLAKNAQEIRDQW